MQDIQEEGVYANGFVTVQPMPVEVHGPEARKTLPLRRIEKVLEDTELQEHVSKELQKVLHSSLFHTHVQTPTILFTVKRVKPKDAAT